jgi:MurNAc alpha-1-phosphate uridylyltransferase
MIDTLLIFAAGFGKRLYPMTQDKPKPLINIAGKPILYYSLDLALKFNFKRIIVNCHYFHDQIQQAIDSYVNKFKPDIDIITIHEPKLLETGGAIKNSYRFFRGQDAIFTLNSDSIISTEINVWQTMIEKWNPLIMDFMLLVTPINKSFGSMGRGDFDINQDGSLNNANNLRNFMFSGLQILKPELINQNPNDVFSISEYYNPEEYRMFGHVNKGNFYHISNVEDYQKINSISIKNKV